MNNSIFKAYDIRGIYKKDFDEDTFYTIGYAIIRSLKMHRVAVGRDARESGPSLKSALIRGILDAGGDVIDLDMITTPMLYFASWYISDIDGAISVTASHNPAEYNGIKICRANAVPVGENSGLNDIRDLTIELLQDPAKLQKTKEKFTVHTKDIKENYYNYIIKFAQLGNKTFHIAIDCANTMGVLELPIYQKLKKNITITPLYCDLTHPYSAHEANPLNTATLEELQHTVVRSGADLGIAYDGDADRIGFVDEHGELIPMDLITGLLAQVFLKAQPGETVLYDLRSSYAVRESIEEVGGMAHECRVGHSFIKKQLAEENGLFAGELSGHYYFKANKYGELSTLVALTLLNLMADTGKTISELVSHLRRYYHSGEINSTVQNPDAIIQKLKSVYHDGELTELDGIKISFWDDMPPGSRWWFNVRLSNTEPVLRLNLEADSRQLMEEKRDEVLAIIRNK